jgi:hypothetical protein
MMPSRVRKLRSLLERKESNATEAASKKDAREDFTNLRIRESGRDCSGLIHLVKAQERR